MTDVFFSGIGSWYEGDDEKDYPPLQITQGMLLSGVFKLTEVDAMEYRHTGKLPLNINYLDPSLTHSDCLFSRFNLSEFPEQCTLHIDTEKPMTIVIAAPDTAKNNPEAESKRISDHSTQLRALTNASTIYWSNADRDDKTTWPKTKLVTGYLIERGYSATLAERGASIIRPDWAGTGNIPKEL